jgi:hypothetical protein
MANRYGEAALLAAKMETFGKSLTARDRWDAAMLQVYPTAEAARKKNAPRGAFIGLCEAGLVRNVKAGHGAEANRNGDRAVEAVRMLRAGEAKTVTQLWAAVGDQEEHQSQMDVVLALWKNGLLGEQVS